MVFSLFTETKYPQINSPNSTVKTKNLNTMYAHQYTFYTYKIVVTVKPTYSNRAPVKSTNRLLEQVFTFPIYICL